MTIPGIPTQPIVRSRNQNLRKQTEQSFLQQQEKKRKIEHGVTKASSNANNNHVAFQQGLLTIQDLPRELFYLIIKEMSAAQVSILAAVSKGIKNSVYSENNPKVYHLNLLEYDKQESLQAKLVEIQHLTKIKISGLRVQKKLHIKTGCLNDFDDTFLWNNLQSKRSEAKLNMLKLALCGLDETFKFNTIQCDLSSNSLTTNKFSTINHSLLSKMGMLTSLDIGRNNIGAGGAKDIATSQHLNNLTSLNIYNNDIKDEGAKLDLVARFPFAKV